MSEILSEIEVIPVSEDWLVSEILSEIEDELESEDGAVVSGDGVVPPHVDPVGPVGPLGLVIVVCV